MIALIAESKSAHLISDVHVADRQLQVPDYSVDEALEHAAAPSLGILLFLQCVYQSPSCPHLVMTAVSLCGNLIGQAVLIASTLLPLSCDETFD